MLKQIYNKKLKFYYIRYLNLNLYTLGIFIIKKYNKYI